ncbi:alpha/beta fold hydrolase [Glycomyces halotolerans]
MRQKYRLATRAPKADHLFESRWARIRGIRLHYRSSRSAAPGATPVVLVHGMALSHRYLMPLAAHLTPRYAVRAIDLPGFGLSGKTGTVPRVPDFADWLADWLTATGDAPAVFLGNSFGTQVTVDLAVRYPRLVRSLVIVGPTMDPHARTMPRQVLRWLAGLPREDPCQLPILVRDLLDAGPFRVVRTFRRALRDPIEEKLPHVQAPTLVARGEHEAVASQRWAEQAVGLLSRGELAVVPNSPHGVPYTAAAELAAIALPFLDRTSRRPPHERAPLRRPPSRW